MSPAHHKTGSTNAADWGANAAPAAPAQTVKDSLTTAPAGPVIKVLVRGSNAPLHVTGWYGDTVFVDLPEAAPAAPAPALEPLTQGERRRLWNNSPEMHGDVTSRNAFERLVQMVESVHGIGIAASKESK